jgi:hypothetical protein
VSRAPPTPRRCRRLAGDDRTKAGDDGTLAADDQPKAGDDRSPHTDDGACTRTTAPTRARPDPSFPRRLPSFRWPAPSFPRRAPAVLRSAPSFRWPAPSFPRRAPAVLRSAPSFLHRAPAVLRSAPSFGGWDLPFSRRPLPSEAGTCRSLAGPFLPASSPFPAACLAFLRASVPFLSAPRPAFLRRPPPFLRTPFPSGGAGRIFGNRPVRCLERIPGGAGATAGKAVRFGTLHPECPDASAQRSTLAWEPPCHPPSTTFPYLSRRGPRSRYVGAGGRQTRR